MIKALYTAATGMQAQQTEVDVIAHNLANVNTSGYKKSRTNFEDLLYLTLQQPGATSGDSALNGIQIGSGSRLVSTSKVFSPGVLTDTQQPLDMSISGDGFFELQGANGERFFTRDGHFVVDANGDVVNSQGLKLQPQLNIPQEAEGITISKDGIVSYVTGDTTQELGQINLVRFINPAGLDAVGGNLFRATANSGDAQNVLPGREGTGSIIQGYLERSNVDVARELISLILAQRAYEVNSRAIRTSDEMLNTTNNLTR